MKFPEDVFGIQITSLGNDNDLTFTPTIPWFELLNRAPVFNFKWSFAPNFHDLRLEFMIIG